MWCRFVWIQPKILFGHCWLFFQFFLNWRSHFYDHKCCDSLFEAPFCSIQYTEMCCVWFRPTVCVQPLCGFLFDMAHTAYYFKCRTPKWEWESRGCCEISYVYAQTHCPTTSRWIFSLVRIAQHTPSRRSWKPSWDYVWQSDALSFTYPAQTLPPHWLEHTLQAPDRH